MTWHAPPGYVVFPTDVRIDDFVNEDIFTYVTRGAAQRRCDRLNSDIEVPRFEWRPVRESGWSWRPVAFQNRLEAFNLEIPTAA